MGDISIVISKLHYISKRNPYFDILHETENNLVRCAPCALQAFVHVLVHEPLMSQQSDRYEMWPFLRSSLLACGLSPTFIVICYRLFLSILLKVIVSSLLH